MERSLSVSFLRNRVIMPELLDRASPTDATRTLADLMRLNTQFGGHKILRNLLARLVRLQEDFTMLDVGAASGDTSHIVRELYPSARVINLDRHEFNLRGAPHPKMLADAFLLPFSDHSLDVVHCSLVLHHFVDDDVIRIFSELRRVARRAVLVSDLERHIVGYWFLSLSKFIYKWHWMTIYDGKLSVRAAFTVKEMQDLAHRAGFREAIVERHKRNYRISLIAFVDAYESARTLN